MPQETIFSPATQGVSMRVNPLELGSREFASATNIAFREKTIKTRPGFRYQPTGVKGRFQGVNLYLPSKGLSCESFGPEAEIIALAAGGKVHAIYFQGNCVSSTITIRGISFPEDWDVDLYQAENLLVSGSIAGKTFTWTGHAQCKGKQSPGLASEEDECDPSHDRLEGFENFLLGGVATGFYAHGRVHQYLDHVFVSDLIHKRHDDTTDITLMEEQMSGAHGDPISVNTRMGKLRAFSLWTRPGTANGEGVLVGYFDCGIVFFGTDSAPRETRVNPETGEITQQGWSERQLVNYRLGKISAVGRYAVADMPHDNAFRSAYGLHFLTFSLGEGTIQDESTNITSTKLEPLLNCDDDRYLSGSAVGHSIQLSRLFATTGMWQSDEHSTSPMGRGFVSWNQAASFTEDRTPRPEWEGLWSPDSGVAGIHRFIQKKNEFQKYDFGFISSRQDRSIDYVTIDENAGSDVRDGVEIPIEWELETGQFPLSGLASIDEITQGRLDVTYRNNQTRVRVFIRTDKHQCYELWKELEKCDSEIGSTQLVREESDLGRPPATVRESTWIQIRIQGIGQCELHQMNVDWSTKETRKKTRCVLTEICDPNYHKFNIEPASSRWK